MHTEKRSLRGGVGVAVVFAGAILATGRVEAATSPLGSVRIQVLVVGGTAHASEFSLKIKKSGPIDTGSIVGSGNTVTFSSLTPGTYKITVSGPSGYHATWGGDCNAQGELSIGIGTEASCTLTQTYGSGAGGGGGGGGDTPTPPPTRGSGRSDRTGSNRSPR